jgi:hypothetical protein
MKTALVAFCAIGALLAPLTGMAACTLEEVTFRGVVVDADGNPVPNAVLDTRWSEPAAGDLSNRRTSAPNGAFDVKLAYDTFSSRSFGGKEKCEFKLQRVEVNATRSGFKPEKLRFEMAALAEPVRIELRPAR